MGWLYMTKAWWRIFISDLGESHRFWLWLGAFLVPDHFSEPPLAFCELNTIVIRTQSKYFLENVFKVVCNISAILASILMYTALLVSKVYTCMCNIILSGYNIHLGCQHYKYSNLFDLLQNYSCDNGTVPWFIEFMLLFSEMLPNKAATMGPFTIMGWLQCQHE